MADQGPFTCQNCLNPCEEIFPIGGYEACDDCYTLACSPVHLRG